MNKKLMALAVAGALTAPGLAVAQVGSSPGVTLYGRLDEAVMNQKFSVSGNGAISEVKKGDLYSAGNALGVRGREDLGGGTALWFQLEAGVNPDGRIDNAATTGSAFGGRNSGLGVSSGLGDIMFGIWDTPYKVAYGTANVINSGGFASSGIIMGNGDQTGALNNALCATALSNTAGSITTTANGVCVTEATAAATAFSRRINNSIQYWSPVFEGFQARLMTAMANYQSPGSAQFASGLPKAKEMSFSLAWASGPLALAFGYDSHQGLRPSTAINTQANPKDTGMQAGGKFDFGLGQVGVGYEKLKYGDNGAAGANNGGMEVPALVVNGRVNAGPGAVWLSYSKTSGGKSCTAATTTIGSASCGIQAKMTVLGYDYVMSKRTKMYVAFAKIDNGFANGVGTNYYYIAGPAGNNPGVTNAAGQQISGTAGGITAGTDVTTLGLGIQHTF